VDESAHTVTYDYYDSKGADQTVTVDYLKSKCRPQR
jgi:hypothetical protein